jgi:DNA (cytosine-5)-methyltransferase 1
MTQQINIFEGFIPRYKITKPIRLIEMFAGIGSQYQALKNLGVNVEHHKIVEWQVDSIQTYNDIHVRDYRNHSENLTDSEVIDKLVSLGISKDYNAPMTLEQVKRKGIEWARKVYNNIVATKNLVNISYVQGKDLEITETNKYDYVLTYSFPCQDLSLAGKLGGMSRNSGTRSGLLWEVERILKESKQLPKILLMENVPDVIGSNFIKDFKEWEEFLRSLGYSNFTEILNAKDYGIPQNRQRAFMVSVLGEYLYDFPQKQPLKLRLKDMLEEKVDEKYYLSHNLVKFFEKHTQKQKELGNGFAFSPTDGNSVAKCVTTKNGTRPDDNYVKDIFISQDKRLPEMIDKIDFNSNEPQSLDLYNRTVSDISQTLTLPNHNSQAIVVKGVKRIGGLFDNEKGKHQAGSIYDSKGLSPTIDTMSGGHRQPLIIEPSITIPEDTKLGYALEYESDGIYINRPHQKRGVVQKQMIQTIKTDSSDIGVVVKEYSDYSIEKIKGNLVDTNGVEIVIGSTQKNAFVGSINEHAPSLTSAMGSGGGHTPMITNNLRIRKLTPKECYRLMGFSDKAFDYAQENASNSTLYHQAGDSIVVNVLMAIFKELL